jgi:hypothetical protein
VSNVIPASCTLNQEFIGKVKPAILRVWNSVAADLCDDDDEMSNQLAIEYCIDADRLWLCGEDKDANDLVREQCKIHGHTRVLKFLSRNISIY